MNRRQLITVAPALAFLPGAAPAMSPDPVIDLSRQFIGLCYEIERLAELPGAGNYDTPEIEALEEVRGGLMAKLAKAVPTSFEGIAWLAMTRHTYDPGEGELRDYALDDWAGLNMARAARALTGHSPIMIPTAQDART